MADAAAARSVELALAPGPAPAPPTPLTAALAKPLPEWGSALRLFSQLVKFIKSLIVLHGRGSVLERARLTASYFARIRATGLPAYDVLRLLVPRVSEAVGQNALGSRNGCALLPLTP